MLGFVLAVLVPAFAITQFIVNRYRDERQQLASVWSGRGQHELASRPSAAVTDFETALAYGPERTSDRFLLARALVSAGRPAEASAQLLTLAADDPADADVNLELGRLEAAQGSVSDAVRYYHGAIDGVWASNSVESRRRARIELARLLMSRGQNVRAQAELIALVDELPDNAMLLTDVGNLLRQAGASGRALTLFRRALAVDRGYAKAARLAGDVEFRDGDMAAARRDLADANAHGISDEETRQLLDLSERVLALDASAAGLSIRERAQRALRLLALAQARFARCRDEWSNGPVASDTVSELAERLAATKKHSLALLLRDADLIDDDVRLAFDVEKHANCSRDTADDRAVSMLTRPRAPQSQ